jgi:methylase of polypeptide subunit release factors
MANSMTHSFDQDYWERHWQQTSSDAAGAMDGNPASPYLAQEAGHLAPGTALDAGCGAGAEAIWLAARGWQVTAADIAADALARAARRAGDSGVSDRVRWVEADLTVWQPDRQFDLVTTNYAHPAMPQLAFYDRIAGWVAPGGSLLIVGHLHTESTEHTHEHGHPGPEHDDQRPPAEASVTLAAITARLDSAQWTIDTAAEHTRTLVGPGGRPLTLPDVVVRATRLGAR